MRRIRKEIKLLSNLLLVAIMLCVIINIGCLSVVSDCKNRLHKAQQEAIRDQQAYDRLCQLYLKNIKSTSRIVPSNTLEAIRYAMKCAHPDNGGKAEDFIKYQKCYEELKNL